MACGTCGRIRAAIRRPVTRMVQIMRPPAKRQERPTPGRLSTTGADGRRITQVSYTVERVGRLFEARIKGLRLAIRSNTEAKTVAGLEAALRRAEDIQSAVEVDLEGRTFRWLTPTPPPGSPAQPHPKDTP